MLVGTHKSIFKGEVRRKIYSFDYYYDQIIEHYEVFDYKTIEETFLKDPILPKGTYVYLASQDKKVRVEDVIRSTDDSTIYLTDFVVEDIEDEQSKLSKIEAEYKMKLSKKEEELKKHKLKLELAEKGKIEIQCEYRDKKWW